MGKHSKKPTTAVKSRDSLAKSTFQNDSGGKGSSKLSELQRRFRDKLDGARFRSLNEKLYTCRGHEALELFQGDPALFAVYHEGYRKQVESWPENPLDRIIHWIRSQDSRLIVADMGCGEARLAASVSNTTHSFDLVSTKPSVTACDIAHVPLADESVDIVVFCLSLMGTNISEFLKEAHRILKTDGMMKIAEVQSRFHETGKNGIHEFMGCIERAGFNIIKKSTENKMVFMLDCKKTSRKAHFDNKVVAKPCLYKKR